MILSGFIANRLCSMRRQIRQIYSTDEVLPCQSSILSADDMSSAVLAGLLVFGMQGLSSVATIEQSYSFLRRNSRDPLGSLDLKPDCSEDLTEVLGSIIDTMQFKAGSFCARHRSEDSLYFQCRIMSLREHIVWTKQLQL